MKLRSRFLPAACAAAAIAVAGCGGEPHDAASGADDRADGPLVAAMMPNIPPYLYLDPDTGEVKGIDVDIVRAAAARLGRDLEIRTVPFAEVLPSVKNGTADFGAAAITITEGRSRDADFSDSYAEEGCAFLVADVSDKGVPAALFMMRAKTLLKNLAQTGRPLDEAVAAANEALCEGNAANMFVTAWVGEIDLASGTVRYVNAGHNPPVVLRAKDGSADYLRSRPGLVLGAMPGAKYRTGEISLGPGDALYLYTDGLTEQTDPNGELFGEARLELLLAGGGFLAHPEACTGAVLAGVEAHAAGAPQSDDRTQLLLLWRGDVDRLHPNRA